MLPSWAERPTGEDYNGEEGETLPWYESDFFGGFQYTGGTSTSTVTQLRQSSEYRSRDWGSSYSTEHHLVPISGSPNLEWDSTGSGNSFLTGIASYTSAHIDGQSVAYVYSGSAGGNSFDHAANYVESRSLTSGWDKNYDRQNTYELAEVSTGTYGWRKTEATEELHATAFALAEFSFASEWDYNTSGGSWSEAHTGYAQIDLTEQADSYYDLSQTTTYDASGSPSFTGTKSYGRDVTSELTRDIEDWHDEAGSTGSDGGILTWTSDSYEFGHSWSQNLETSAITTDSYNSVAGEIDWSHGQGLYGLPIGWEDYQFEYEMAVAPPGGGMSNIAAAHGLNPENLYLLDTPGTLPTSSHFVDANFEVPENVDYEAPPLPPAEGFEVEEEELDIPNQLTKTPADIPPARPTMTRSFGILEGEAEFEDLLQLNRQGIDHVQHNVIPAAETALEIGAELAIPPLGLASEIKTAVAGEDIWGNQASTLDRTLAAGSLGIASLPIIGTIVRKLRGLGGAADAVSDAKRIAGHLDPMVGGPNSGQNGRRGGKRLTRSEMSELRREAKELGGRIESHSDEYLDRKNFAGAFDYATGVVYLRSGATFYEAFHEMSHLRHWARLGRDAYVGLGKYAREAHVFHEIWANRRLFTNEELQDAIDAIRYWRAKFNAEEIN